ncbi:hypothetical protein AB0J21_09365 [Streptomyces sp. NPDC049954]|uniref:hypothetical protein n=1 Tax=Streptomyces sp. NPDC049954 TaxID=3155779 RepID=UPI0034216E4A
MRGGSAGISAALSAVLLLVPAPDGTATPGPARPSADGASAQQLHTALIAAASSSSSSDSYGFAPGTRPVEGRSSSTEAPELRADGTPYRSSVALVDGALYYRLELTAREDTYVSAVAIPGAGSPVEYADGVRLTLQDREGNRCDTADATLGAAAYPRPLGVSVERAVRAGSVRCQEAGTYYLVVERRAGRTPGAEPWDLDVRAFAEPPLRDAPATATPAPQPSVSLPPPGGTPVRRPGGTGFAMSGTEGEVGEGVWRDTLRPGTTRFYRLPLDWGEQVSVTAELGSAVASGTGRPFVSSALTVSLSNPARAQAVSDGVTYTGRPVSAELDPGAPVAYENRFVARRAQNAMRFPGTYYVAVSLSPELAGAFGDGPLGVTLRIAVRDSGATGRTPVYAGDPGIFRAGGGDRASAGAEGTGAAGGTKWRLLSVGGFGTGTALVLWMAGWALLARRRAGGRTRSRSAPPRF